MGVAMATVYILTHLTLRPMRKYFRCEHKNLNDQKMTNELSIMRFKRH